MSRLHIAQLSAPGIEVKDLAIDSGACVAITGASGSGKTRMLRAIADLDPARGEILLDAQSRSEISGPEWRRRVIYLAAESHWWGDLVSEHAADWSNCGLDELGFDSDVLAWEVQRLSSGERQRLALARALAHRPDALLLDEATANLDPASTDAVEALIKHWREETDGCALWVSHDPAQRRRVATAEYRVEAGRLRIQDGA